MGNIFNKGEVLMEKTITLAHGAGGKQTSELIDKVFKSAVDG